MSQESDDMGKHPKLQEKPDEAPLSGDTPEVSNPDDIKYDIVAVLKTVYDPEIPVDIYELGLIYELEVDEGGVAHIVMTLTESFDTSSMRSKNHTSVDALLEARSRAAAFELHAVTSSGAPKMAFRCSRSFHAWTALAASKPTPDPEESGGHH